MSHTIHRRKLTLVLACAIAGTGLSGGVALAQDFPTKPIRLIVPFPAGGTSDAMARTIGPLLQSVLGQSVIVENRPGAGTLIATRAVLNGPADGYTVLMNTSTMATNALAYKAPGYRMSDFTAVAPVSSSSLMLSVHESVPATNLAEFVAYAKDHPDKLNAVTFGGAAMTTLAFDRFMTRTGIKMVTVNYVGSAPANQALLGGFVNVFLDGTATAVQTHKVGKTRMLGVTSAQRSALAPSVPTFAEQGFPYMTVAAWTGIFVSAKTPDAIVQRLRSAFVDVLSRPDVRQRISGLGFDVWNGRAEDFTAFIRDDMASFEQDIRRAGLSLE